jgi:hypothetical protein
MYMVDQNADDARKLLTQWHSVVDYASTRAKDFTELATLTGPLQKNGKKRYCIMRGSTLSHYEGEPSKENGSFIFQSRNQNFVLVRSESHWCPL